MWWCARPRKGLQCPQTLSLHAWWDLGTRLPKGVADLSKVATQLYQECIGYIHCTCSSMKKIPGFWTTVLFVGLVYFFVVLEGCGNEATPLGWYGNETVWSGNEVVRYRPLTMFMCERFFFLLPSLLFRQLSEYSAYDFANNAYKVSWPETNQCTCMYFVL